MVEILAHSTPYKNSQTCVFEMLQCASAFSLGHSFVVPLLGEDGMIQSTKPLNNARLFCKVQGTIPCAPHLMMVIFVNVNTVTIVLRHRAFHSWFDNHQL